MTIYQVILYFITAVTIVLQSYLFYLIRYKSPKAMEQYEFYLNYYTGFDLLFTIINGAFLQFEPTGILMSVQIYGISSYFGPRAEITTTAFVFYVGFNVILSQIYCNLYRYASLHNKQMHNMFGASRMKLILFIVSQIFCSIVFVFFYKIIVLPEEFFDENIQNQVVLEVRKHVEPGHFVITFIPVEITWIPRFFMVFTLVFFLCSELLSAYVIYAILSTLKKNIENFSKTMYRLHHQLTILLAVQLTIPLVLIVFPISIRFIVFPISIRFIVFLLTENQLAAFNKIRMILITLYGGINSLSAIIFISPYRRYTYNTFIAPILLPSRNMRSHHQDSAQMSS